VIIFYFCFTNGFKSSHSVAGRVIFSLGFFSQSCLSGDRWDKLLQVI